MEGFSSVKISYGIIISNQMIRAQQEKCEEILNSILQVECLDLIKNIDILPTKENPHPISLYDIQTRLENHTYTSTLPFIQDFRTLFYHHINRYSKDSIEYLIIKRIQEIFEGLIKNGTFFTNNGTLVLIKAEKQLSNIHQVIKSRALLEISQVSDDKNPASVVFQEAEEITPEKLTRYIELLIDTKSILKVAKYIYNLQKECIIIDDEQLTFNFSLMNPDSIRSVYDFVLQLLYEKAQSG